MPRIEIQAPNGEYRQIHSSDPEILARWFYEWMHEAGPRFHPYDHFYLRMQPLFNRGPDGRDIPDWCPDQSHWAHHEVQVTFGDQLEELIAALEKMRSSEK